MSEAARSPALETRGLCKSFGALQVANSIDFRLERGARHALIGPNGAGKTSFVNLVTGALAPSAGQVLIDGTEVTDLPQSERVKRGLARTFQVTALFRRLTALENVTLGIAEREGVADDLFWPSGRHKRVIEEAYAVLESLDLADDALRPVNMLAYGRQRLVEIAVSLALAPKVLLLDGGGGAVGRERHDHRGDRAAAAGDRTADHRARYGSGISRGAADHRHGAGRRAGRR